MSLQLETNSNRIEFDTLEIVSIDIDEFYTREVKYQEIIDKLTEKFGVIDTIKNDVDYIKEKLIDHTYFNSF